jgi:SAM-dependent methyltransferase
LNECVRVLKPGGRLILCLPNIAHWLCRWWLLTGRFPYVENSPTDALHIRFFTVSGTSDLCRDRGLTVVGVDGSASLWAKDFYPAAVRWRRLRGIYTWLAHRWPSLFARDFVMVAVKGDHRDA